VVSARVVAVRVAAAVTVAAGLRIVARLRRRLLLGELAQLLQRVLQAWLFGAGFFVTLGCEVALGGCGWHRDRDQTSLLL